MQRVFRAVVRSFPVKSEAGVTAIEYGLIASLIAIVIVGAVTLIGSKLGAVFTSVAGDL